MIEKQMDSDVKKKVWHFALLPVYTFFNLLLLDNYVNHFISSYFTLLLCTVQATICQQFYLNNNHFGLFTWRKTMYFSISMQTQCNVIDISCFGNGGVILLNLNNQIGMYTYTHIKWRSFETFHWFFCFILFTRSWIRTLLFMFFRSDGVQWYCCCCCCCDSQFESIVFFCIVPQTCLILWN